MHALEPAWENIKREFNVGCSQAEQSARARIVHDLNQFLRRLRQYQTEGEWVSALLDGASHFVEQAAVFGIERDTLRLRGRVGLDIAENLTFPVSSAAAFASAIESKDSVISLRTAAEVSEHLSAPEQGERAHFIPILNGSRTVAVLFAASHGQVDLNALELIASMASMVLERKSNESLHAAIAKAQTTSAPELKRTTFAFPVWADLDDEKRGLHIRAQRYSRTAVAKMQLSRPDACQAGREQANLYLFLQKEIDQARETYRKQFMTVPSMVDYLHLELIHTAAEDDEIKLGADYPGQLL